MNSTMSTVERVPAGQLWRRVALGATDFAPSHYGEDPYQSGPALIELVGRGRVAVVRRIRRHR